METLSNVPLASVHGRCAAAALSCIQGWTDLMGIRAMPWGQSLWELTPAIHVNLKRAQIAVKIAFAWVPEGVSVRPWLYSVEGSPKISCGFYFL